MKGCKNPFTKQIIESSYIKFKNPAMMIVWHGRKTGISRE